MDNKYELIITICNHGFNEAVMETAKLAGARGGTIMHGRGSATKDVKKFFGITIHPEKDVIFIITTHAKKTEIMKAITTNHGITAEAHAICFSIPVDEAIGFNF